MNKKIKLIISKIFYYFGGLFLTKYLARSGKQLVILNYHHFNLFYRTGEEDSYFKSDTNQKFSHQLAFLNKHFGVVSVESLYDEKQRFNSLKVALTFDDGYLDNVTHALPALIENNIQHCCFFLATDAVTQQSLLWHDVARLSYLNNLVSKEEVEAKLKSINSGKWFSLEYFDELRNQLNTVQQHSLMMSWAQAGLLISAGFEVGAHTCSHAPLTFLTADQQASEINGSIATVDKNLAIASKHFAYPNGLFNDATLAIMRNNHIDYAYSTICGINTPDTDKHCLKRIGINTFDSKSVVLLKIFKAVIKGS